MWYQPQRNKPSPFLVPDQRVREDPHPQHDSDRPPRGSYRGRRSWLAWLILIILLLAAAAYVLFVVR